MFSSLLRTLESLTDAAFAKSMRRTPPKIEAANREMSNMDESLMILSISFRNQETFLKLEGSNRTS
jgi:hypothetical protein